MEILEESDVVPQRPARPPGPALLGVGHHPDRLRQHLRLLHRAVGAGQGDQPAVRRGRGRGPGPGRRRHRRGHAARPERQLLRPRPHPAAGRCSPSCCGRSARSTASAGSATRARTRRTCGPRRSRPWPTSAAVVRAPPPAAPVGERPDPGGHAPGLHRRALPGEAGRGPGRACRTWPSPPTSSWASPARPTTTSSAPSRWWPRPRTTAPTRSCSRPGPAPRPRRCADRFVPAEVVGRAVRAPAGRRRALGPGPAPGPGRPGRGGAGRGAEQEGPGGGHRPHPPEQARALPAPARCRAARARSPTCAITGAAAALPAGRAGGGDRPAPAPHPHPGGRRLSDAGPGRSPGPGGPNSHPDPGGPHADPGPGGPHADPTLAGPCQSRSQPRRAAGHETSGPRGADGVGQVGAGAGGRPAAGRRRARVGRLDAGVPGHGHRHGQADAGRAGRGPPPPARHRRPRRGVHRHPLPGRRSPRPSPSIEARGHRALLVGGTGLYLRAVVDGLALPGQWPEVRAELEAEADTGRRCTAGSPSSTHRGRPHGAGQRRRIVRALEVTLGSGRPFSSFGPGLDAYPPDPRSAGRRCGCPDRSLPDRIESAVRGAAGRRLPRRGAVPWPRQASCPAPPARPWATRSCWPTSPATCPLDEASPQPCAAPGRFARRQRAWFRRDPRITWFGRGRESGRSTARPPGRLVRLRMILQLDEAPRPGQRLPRPPRPGPPHAARPRTLARALCDRHRGVGADGAHPGDARPRAADVMELRNADGSRAEMSGNGIRCLAQAVVDAGPGAGPRSSRSPPTRASSGHRRAETATGCGMSASTWARPRSTDHRRRRTLVDMGNPHLVIAATRTGRATSQALGRADPDRNVELVAVGRAPTSSTCGCGSGAWARPWRAAPAPARRPPPPTRWGLVGRRG